MKRKPTARPRVALSSCASYNPVAVHRAVQEGIEKLGGIEASVGNARRALLKINLLGPRGPDRAATTHPELVRAVARLVQSAGCRVDAGDSPVVGGIDRAALISGLSSLYAEVGATLRDFTAARPMAVPVPARAGHPMIELFSELEQYNLLVDLPKVKSHAFQVMSGAIKNLFGLVPGNRKEAFHRIHPHPEDFAELLLDIYRLTPPELVVVDAIDVPLADCPGGRGGIHRLGLVCVANDALAADVVLSEVLGIGSERVPVIVAARRARLPAADIDGIEILGGLPSERLGSGRRGASPATGWPVCDEVRCNSCGACADVCPVDAIEMHEGRPQFVLDTCIRCYCCEEFCETDAITAQLLAGPDPVSLRITAGPSRSRPGEPVTTSLTGRLREPPAQAVTFVVPAPFGVRGHRISLGVAQLRACLAAVGEQTYLADVSGAVARADAGLFDDLERKGMPLPGGGLCAPRPHDLLRVLRPGGFRDQPDWVQRANAAVIEAADILASSRIQLLSVNDANLIFGCALARELRARGSRVVLGGSSITMHADVRKLLLRAEAADALFVGEAEDGIATLVEALRRDADLRVLAAIPGVLVSEQQPALAQQCKDLEVLPVPDFSGVALDDWLPIIAGRGCPRGCSFCSAPAATPRARVRSAASVVREMQALAQRWNVSAFELNDDLLDADPRWLPAFADRLHGYGLTWAGFVEPRRHERDFWKTLAASGCRALTFGVQSFSARLLRTMYRSPDADVVRDALFSARDAGISVQFDLIVGHPGESEEDFSTTLAAVHEILAASPEIDVNLNPFQLVPESPVWRQPEAFGVRFEPEPVSLPDELSGFCDLTATRPRARWLPGEQTVADRATRLAEAIYEYKKPKPVPIVDEELPTCNNHCVFCGVSDLRPTARKPGGSEIRSALSALASSGEDRVMFAVSELTLRPDFLEILGAARDAGFTAVYLVTNGRVFAYPRRARAAVCAGATHFLVSLHGATAASHDALTRTPGSFVQSTAGIRNLLAAGAVMATNTVVCRANLGQLGDVVALAASLGVAWATLSSMQIIGEAARHADRLVVPLAEAVPHMRAAAHLGERHGMRVGLGGVPYCLVPGAEHLVGVDDLSAIARGPQTNAITHKPPYERPMSCRACAYAGVCSGLAQGYLQRFGDGELRAVEGRRLTRRPACPAAALVLGDTSSLSAPGLGGRPVP